MEKNCFLDGGEDGECEASVLVLKKGEEKKAAQNMLNCNTEKSCRLDGEEKGYKTSVLGNDMQVSQGMLKGNNGKIYSGRQVEVKYKIKITKLGLWKIWGFRITAVYSI